MPSSSDPCIYKAKCKTCQWVDKVNRPEGCVKLECKHYTPCLQCGKNRILDDANLCQDCAAPAKSKATSLVTPSPIVRELIDNIKAEDAENKTFTPTIPGEPPEELNEKERQYYAQRWEQFKGFYRSPAAYAVCHNIILEEINLSYLQSMTLSTRGERQGAYEKSKVKAILMISNLQKQLPEKEALDETDDDKAMAVIYEAYCKEKKLISYGPVSRRVTQDAIALNPVLLYKGDLPDQLRRCGFQLVDIEEALKRKGIDWNNVPQELDDILEFLGFRHREEYALNFKPPEEPLLTDERIEEPDPTT